MLELQIGFYNISRWSKYLAKFESKTKEIYAWKEKMVALFNPQKVI